jgi:hypothetical protein
VKKRFSAVLAMAVVCVPALLAAQQAPAQQTAVKEPSPFQAIELRQELRITPEQLARITVARDSLREAHRVHCGPMHATKPTEAEEARHHAEMAAINARYEGQARAAMTAEQLQRLAALHAARPAHPAGHGSHSGHGASPAKPAEHQGHHPSR